MCTKNTCSLPLRCHSMNVLHMWADGLVSCSISRIQSRADGLSGSPFHRCKQTMKCPWSEQGLFLSVKQQLPLTFLAIHNSAKELMLSLHSVSFFVGGFVSRVTQKLLKTDFPETLMEDGPRPRIDRIIFQCRSGKGDEYWLFYFFSLFSPSSSFLRE